MDGGLAQGIVGLALFVFPGVAWTLALAPGIGWAKAAAVSLVMAFTITPGALFLLNVLFNLPIRLATMTFLAVALGMVAVAVRSSAWVGSRLRE